MSHANAQLITRFYEAFQRLDAEEMAACYADDAVFSDPAFGELHGGEIGDMWRMLTQRAQGFSVAFGDVEATGDTGSADWVASYRFTQTGRPVVNRVHSHLVFRDGRIVEQRDTFDLWKWSQQALGTKGALLGWTSLVQGAIRRQARNGLALWREKAGRN